MLARVAANFYWMGRYLERTKQTIRLVRYPLDRLVDRTASEIAVAWEVVYRTLGQMPPHSPDSSDEAETFLMTDAYTLAGSLIEESLEPRIHSFVLEHRPRERPAGALPSSRFRCGTCLNQGYLWMRSSDFPTAWASGPAALVSEASDRLRHLAGVMDALMYRDDGWRFMVLGHFVERVQHQAAFLAAWVELGRRERGASALPWADLLRICGAYEVYSRRYSMEVRQEQVLVFLVQDPELPRSLRFSVHLIEEVLAGIDPAGARYPLAPPHRMALRIAAALEVENLDGERERDSIRFFRSIGSECRKLHDFAVGAYLDFPPAQGFET